MSDPTPCPWTWSLEEIPMGLRWRLNPNILTIDHLMGEPGAPIIGIDPAHARLIAAAPDLLAALTEARDWILDDAVISWLKVVSITHDEAALRVTEHPLIIQIDAAIAKTKGESE